jgi:transglutaminase-like putative cysteine protease
VRYAIAHDLHLTFDAPVWEHQCELRLAPQANAHQTPGTVSLTIDPPAEVRRYRDGHGNEVHCFGITAPHTAVRARLRAEVATNLANPFDYAVVPPARERQWIEESVRAQPRLWNYLLHRSACTPAPAVLAEHGLTPPAHDPDRPLLDSVMAALEWIGTAMEYAPCFATPPLPLAEALAARAGGCQDLAQLLIAVVRGWGFPARYAMGYRDPEYREDDDDEPQALHAWAELLIPGAGWRGVDPTAHLIANDTYVTVAVGRDAFDALPLKQHWKGADEPGAAETVVEVTRDQ